MKNQQDSVASEAEVRKLRNEVTKELNKQARRLDALVRLVDILEIEISRLRDIKWPKEITKRHESQMH